MGDAPHDVNLVLPGSSVVLPQRPLTSVVLPGADVPLVTHGPEPALGDLLYCDEDGTCDDGRVCAALALGRRPALDPESVEEGSGIRGAMPESLDIGNVRRRGDIVAHNHETETEVFVWMDDEELGAF